MDYRPESDIIYPSSGATGASWRLSDDQTECLNSSEIDTSQLVKTDKLTGSRWHHWHWHCAACGGGAGTASLLVRWIISILNTTQQFSEISFTFMKTISDITVYEIKTFLRWLTIKMSSTTIMTLMIMVNVDEYDDVHDLDDENNVTPIPLAFNVEPCFKARLQLLNIRVKSTT